MTIRERIDTAQLNSRIDLRSLAAGYTTLRRASSSELEGPCPRCGGEDRLHVKADMFFCRACYPLGNGHGHDAIGFLRWLHEITFLEAVAMLDSNAVPTVAPRAPQAPHKAQEAQDPAWSSRCTGLMAEYRHAMREGAGQDYAYSRGFTKETMEAFHVGYAANASASGPALALPWYRGGQLYAIHYRYMAKDARPKMKFESGSKVAGLLWGRHAMREGGRVLMIIEGELNAMSVHQVASTAGVDVLSLGGESSTLTPAAVAFAQQYPVRIVWMDKPELAKKQATLVNGGAFWSIETEYKGQSVKCDANELLQRMALVETLRTLLKRAGADARTLGMLGG
jgi:phage/plasmid primase-like uncharacterized protein